MSEVMQQLNLNLEPAQFSIQDYFIPHSGIVESFNAVQETLDKLVSSPESFFVLSFFGPKGCGKTFLSRLCLSLASSLSIASDSVFVFDMDSCLQSESYTDIESSTLDNNHLSRFISNFESLKRKGGLVLILSRSYPELICSNPHFSSRFRLGQCYKINYPSENEVEPILKSISERFNLNLSERSIKYLQLRIPRDPLSFENILAKIRDISFSESKKAGLEVVKQAISVSSISSSNMLKEQS